MRVVAFANQKGGVGKTTSAVNTSVIFANAGHRILLVDLDPQGNSTSSLGVGKDDLDLTTYDVLVDGEAVADAAVRGVRPNLDLLASTPVLAGAEVELVAIPRRERRLAEALERVASDYDLAIIDCPPSLGLLTVNALTAADSVVIPIQCEFLALEGVSQLITTIDLVKRQLNTDLDLLGVLMTMYDGRTRLSSHVVAEVRRHFGERMFDSIVPRSVRLAEAPSYGQSITEYDAASRGGAAYLAFATELGGRVGLTPRVALS